MTDDTSRAPPSASERAGLRAWTAPIGQNPAASAGSRSRPDGYDQRWTDLAAAGAEVHGEADARRRPRSASWCPTPQVARRRLRHRAGGDRAGPARPRHRRRRRRPGAARPGAAPRRPSWSGTCGDLATLPADGRAGAVRRRGAGRQRDDLRRPGHRGRGARHAGVARRAGRTRRRRLPTHRATARSPSTTRAAAAAGWRRSHRFATWDRTPFVPGRRLRGGACDSKR